MTGPLARRWIRARTARLIEVGKLPEPARSQAEGEWWLRSRRRWRRSW